METILIAYLCIILIAATYIDVRYRKIPNYLTITTMLTALFYYGYTGNFYGLVFSLEGIALGIALFFIPWVLGWVGAGDAKLMGAVGSVVGLKGVFLATLFTAVAGGVVAVVVLILNRKYAKDLIAKAKFRFNMFTLKRQFNAIPEATSKTVPRFSYGAVIAFGTFIYIATELSGFRLL